MNTERRKRKKRILLGTVLALLGIILYCCFGPKPPSTQEVAATPTAVLYPTLTPTDTPLPTSTSLPTNTPIPTVGPSIIVGNEGVNLRSGPGTTYERQGYLEYGTRVEAVGYYSGWWQIKYFEELYWVFGELVTAYNVTGVPQVIPEGEEAND